MHSLIVINILIDVKIDEGATLRTEPPTSGTFDLMFRRWLRASGGTRRSASRRSRRITR